MEAEEAKASVKPWWKRIPGVVAILIFWVGLAMAVVSFLKSATLGAILGWAAFLAALFGLGILGGRFKIVDRTIQIFFSAYFRFTGWMLVTLIPLSLFNWLSQFILEHLSLRFQVAVFVVWGLVLTWALLLIATERKREGLFKRFQKIGYFTPVAYSLNLLMIAVTFFSSVTYVLAKHGTLTLNSPAESNVSAGKISDFFFWHFLEAVPLLKVNETLGWKEPLTYDSGWVGLVLLVFKFAVIAPVIAAFAWYWKENQGQKPASSLAHLQRGPTRFRKVVIPGGTGEVGTILAREFHRRGDEVVILSRTPSKAPWRVVEWDGQTLGGWIAELEGADVVINLAGRSVNCRYDDRNRKLIKESRVKSTQALGKAIAQASDPPRVWLQASTATIYAHRYDAANDEATGILGGSERDAPDTWKFSLDVATSWEQALEESVTPRTRKVLLRSAIIMSPDRDGAFDMLLKLVRYRLGGRASYGGQYVSWIHDQDFIRSIFWLIDHDEMDGPVNLAAPNPVPNSEFMRDLRAAWGTSLGLPAKKWMLEIGAILLRTETELILKSRRVVPGRLLESGFVFQFPTWTDAALDLCTRWREDG